MVNPSKQKGTAAETAVVNFARANGFPDADRLTLGGRFDRGDIVLLGSSARPRIIVEVKAHKTFSDADVRVWLGETNAERINAAAQQAFLVVKRPGKGVAQVDHWWAVTMSHIYPERYRPLVSYHYLGEYLNHLRLHGFGEPLD